MYSLEQSMWVIGLELVTTALLFMTFVQRMQTPGQSSKRGGGAWDKAGRQERSARRVRSWRCLQPEGKCQTDDTGVASAGRHWGEDFCQVIPVEEVPAVEVSRPSIGLVTNSCVN